MHPDRIGPYLIDRKIGSGGMGNVYHGTHEDTGEEVAVKVLPASMAREEGFVQRFSREIDALRKVSSPNIVRFFLDGQTDDGSYYFSMEYVDGETLTSMIARRKKIPWQEVIDISLQITTALKAAHNMGIVHRDLKPSNLIVASDGTVKLADFGVAHVFASTRLTRTGGVVGTAEYMSPEQARGQRATKLGDLYSLGAVMYAMLTGRPPFTAKLAAEILHKHQFVQVDRPSHYVDDLPPLLEDLVCRLLEKKPENRLPDAFVVTRQLQNIRARVEFERRARADEQTAVAAMVSGGTAAIGADKTDSGDPAETPHSPGPATMVRNAFREDIQAQLKKSAVARFFDNTFVLIALLGLVIAAGVFLSRASVPDPMEEYRAIFEGKPGTRWLRARDDIQQLLPDPDQELSSADRAQLETWQRAADQYEFCRGLKSAAPSDGTTQSEIQWLVSRAFDAHSSGNVSEATRQLRAVMDILTEDDIYLTTFLQQTLTEWSGDRSVAGRRVLLQRILEDAAVALTDHEDRGAAISMLNAVIVLYGEDQEVNAQVAECRRLLAEFAEDATDKSAASMP